MLANLQEQYVEIPNAVYASSNKENHVANCNNPLVLTGFSGESSGARILEDVVANKIAAPTLSSSLDSNPSVSTPAPQSSPPTTVPTSSAFGQPPYPSFPVPAKHTFSRPLAELAANTPAEVSNEISIKALKSDFRNRPMIPDSESEDSQSDIDESTTTRRPKKSPENDASKLVDVFVELPPSSSKSTKGQDTLRKKPSIKLVKKPAPPQENDDAVIAAELARQEASLALRRPQRRRNAPKSYAPEFDPGGRPLHQESEKRVKPSKRVDNEETDEEDWSQKRKKQSLQVQSATEAKVDFMEREDGEKNPTILTIDDDDVDDDDFESAKSRTKKSKAKTKAKPQVAEKKKQRNEKSKDVKYQPDMYQDGMEKDEEKIPPKHVNQTEKSEHPQNKVSKAFQPQAELLLTPIQSKIDSVELNKSSDVQSMATPTEPSRNLERNSQAQSESPPATHARRMSVTSSTSVTLSSNPVSSNAQRSTMPSITASSRSSNSSNSFFGKPLTSLLNSTNRFGSVRRPGLKKTLKIPSLLSHRNLPPPPPPPISANSKSKKRLLQDDDYVYDADYEALVAKNQKKGSDDDDESGREADHTNEDEKDGQNLGMEEEVYDDD